MTSWPTARRRAHRPFDVGDVHEQIGNQDDQPATVDQTRRLLERFGGAGRPALSRFLERGDDAAPLAVARARGGTARADAIVEADETDGVALAEQQQREGGREPLGVFELGERQCARAAPLQAMERLTSRTIVARRLVSSSYWRTTHRSERAAIFQSM